MNTVYILLSFLLELVPQMMFLFGLLVTLSILLFCTSLSQSEASIITNSSKPGLMTEYYIFNPVTKTNEMHTGIKLNKAELLAKLAMEITPDYSAHLKISQKDQNLAGISLKKDPSNSGWHTNAKVQVRDDGLQDIILNEQNCVLTCDPLSNNCMLVTYANQNEPTAQNLPLSNPVRIILELFCDTSQDADDTSQIRKTKRRAKACPRKTKSKSEPAILPS